MKKSLIILSLITGLSVFIQNCAPCDDCEITPAPKEVKVVSKTGDNLIFGSSSVYNPDNIEVKNDLGEVVEHFTNIDNGTIDFSFAVKSDTYFLKLSATDTDTIVFGFGKDKQIDCCNEFDVTKTTKINGKLVSNSDQITIVK
jgi:hypothetical protein